MEERGLMDNIMDNLMVDIMWMAGCVFVAYLVNKWHHGKLTRWGSMGQYDVLSKILVGSHCYHNIVAVYVHLFMETLFPDGSCLSQQAPWQKAEINQECFRLNNNFEVLSWPPMYHKQLQDSKNLLLISCCQMPQHNFRGLVESVTHNSHAGPGDQDSIRQELMKLWQISIHMRQPGFYELGKRFYFKMMINVY